ncbi:MAG TPA: exodeoxyribonuclease VII small subunit [Ruminococcaceae bacterium]|nr:exodeoxyribonuclease VII small subunit [Oscillospiraceae bacterium]MDD5920724.1 exodeoxyribonuclease VII small subunit [Oscillospiraceae bacterium]HAO68967.1 exodeoxyribonuclease VII small subunit [Oscillospiraceae bacterium]HCB65886.1 exodeoxyribonuclease VII small subunit [Oscillospiraceae bacterium]HCU32675.1 exodeoxyribonuclease VII small subunit [Oscillospiraceae bacterium]
MSKTTAKKDMSLEQAMARIEQILQILDSGQGTLDESLALFEEGTALVRFCNEKLQQAKLRVKEVMAKNESDESEEKLSGTVENV